MIFITLFQKYKTLNLQSIISIESSYEYYLAKNHDSGKFC